MKFPVRASIMIFIQTIYLQYVFMLMLWMVIRFMEYRPLTYVYVLVAQLCPTLCDPMDYNLPGFSIHGIIQARILGQVAIPFSRGSSQPSDQNQVSCMAGRFITV